MGNFHPISFRPMGPFGIVEGALSLGLEVLADIGRASGWEYEEEEESEEQLKETASGGDESTSATGTTTTTAEEDMAAVLVRRNPPELMNWFLRGLESLPGSYHFSREWPESWNDEFWE
jgi:hypothetical protein